MAQEDDATAGAGAGAAAAADGSSGAATNGATDADVDAGAAALRDVLNRLRLTKFADALQAMGVEQLSDLEYLQDSDLAEAGLPLIPRRKLLEAAGGSWRQPPGAGASASAGASAAAASGSAAAANGSAAASDRSASPKGSAREEGNAERAAEGDSVKMEAEEEGGNALAKPSEPATREEAAAEVASAAACPAEMTSQSESPELRQLSSELRERIEDFVDVNGLSPLAHAQLSALAPRVALRTMGLLGSHNDFVIGKHVKPEAVWLQRAQDATDEEKRPEATAALPYESWQRLLDGFVALHGAMGGTAEALRSLDRTHALQVMGFTSGLRFRCGPPPARGAGKAATAGAEKSAAGVASTELEARLRAVRAGVAPTPLLRREGGRSSQSVPSTASATATGAASAGQRRTQPGQRPPLRRPSPAARRAESRSRSPRFPAAGGWTGSSHPGAADAFPYWRQNLQTFVEVNALDERSARALEEVAKIVVLRVMGLVGRGNSFLIRGANNTSAAVMQRLAKAQAPGGRNDDEPYAQLPKLVEDFIAVNGFDERGAEAVRQLGREEALHVMGFQADNAFLIRGAHNPSAALMSRLAQAGRSCRRGSR